MSVHLRLIRCVEESVIVSKEIMMVYKAGEKPEEKRDLKTVKPIPWNNLFPSISF